MICQIFFVPHPQRTNDWLCCILYQVQKSTECSTSNHLMFTLLTANHYPLVNGNPHSCEQAPGLIYFRGLFLEDLKDSGNKISF